MKRLKNKITENRLREIINESVEDVLNRIGIISQLPHLKEGACHKAVGLLTIG